MANRTQWFDHKIATITAERGEKYGNPLDNFDDIGKMYEPVIQCEDNECRHAMYMIIVKMSRLIRTPDHPDSWLDIAGYARAALMALDEKEKRRETFDQREFDF
jgi:hypothetical protein